MLDNYRWWEKVWWWFIIVIIVIGLGIVSVSAFYLHWGYGVFMMFLIFSLIYFHFIKKERVVEE